MNKVFLMGRLTADPEFSMTQSGMAMCRFSIAVDRPARQGEEKQADFFRVVCWQQTAETVNRYFVKGKPIIVEGRIQNNNYTDNNGVKHYGTDIVADRINFVLSDPTRNGNNGGGYSNNNGYQNNNYNNGGYNNNNGYQNNNYNNGGYNNGGYNNNGYNNGGYQNQPNYNNAPPQQSAPPVPQNQPKDIQLGNDGGKGDDFNDFEEIISDGSLPF